MQIFIESCNEQVAMDKLQWTTEVEKISPSECSYTKNQNLVNDLRECYNVDYATHNIT